MTRLLRSPLLAALAVVLVGASALGAPVASSAEPAADDALTWAVVPASAEGPDGRGAIEIIAEPGDSYLDHVAVRNLGTEPLSLELYGQDAVQTVEDSYRVLAPDDEARGVGAWLHLESTEVTVPPRGNVVVALALDIPAGAEPGDHSGGIIAALSVAQGDGGTVRYQVGTRVHVRVAGPVEPALGVELRGGYDGALSPFVPTALELDATLENTGTVRLTPAAIVRVSSLFGLWSVEEPLGDTGELLPGGAGAVSAALADVPPLGPLWVEVRFPTVDSRGQDVAEATRVEAPTIVVWAVPWALLVAVVVLLAAVVVVAVRLRRRRAAARA